MNRASTGRTKPWVSERIKPQIASAKITARMTLATHCLLSTGGEETESIFSGMLSVMQIGNSTFCCRLRQ
jgi:hypothetical protein